MSNEIVTLRTERLTLRPHQLQDASAVYAYASDAEWAQYLPVPQPYELRHAEASPRKISRWTRGR